MKLFYAPGACSLGIHVLLEEVGLPYDAVRVNLREGEQRKPAFAAVNPKGKVPALERDDGAVLTEYPAIAYWIAATNPEAGLLPQGTEAIARAMEVTDYVVATVHMQGFGRIFRPEAFAPSAADHDAVRKQGEDIFTKGLALLDERLAGREWVGDAYSFADTAVFYACFWWAGRLKKELPANVARHYAAMLDRPAVRRAMEAEGLAA